MVKMQKGPFTVIFKYSIQLQLEMLPQDIRSKAYTSWEYTATNSSVENNQRLVNTRVSRITRKHPQPLVLFLCSSLAASGCCWRKHQIKTGPDLTQCNYILPLKHRLRFFNISVQPFSKLNHKIVGAWFICSFINFTDYKTQISAPTT